jgi:NADH-quinone oxidoreductase subunit L
MNYAQYIPLMLLLPLLGFVLIALLGKKYLRTASGWLGTGIMLVVTVLSLYAAWQYFMANGQWNGAYQKIIAVQATWLEFTPDLRIDIGIILDPISVMMLVVVNLVSLMVHLFSIGYMKGEERYSSYFAYLALFTFSMLGLVVSINLFQLYMFWELVGLSSYLLIGFYYQKPSAVAAAKKAFIITRFADLGFLAGILILGIEAQTLNFDTLIGRLTDTQSDAFLRITGQSFAGLSLLSWALALVFMGGAGKSAMFPLHVWLPDAMEGPTPVSALIHAATMVVAGVYLVARLFPLYALNAVVLQLITWIGVLSAILAAVIACTQTDIKRVLAYSTMSQIGYMMFALGVSHQEGNGFTASLFHLFTHAFFKSLLFLGAGAVIHWVHSNEMKDMGGLRKYLPLTHTSFLIACLAIAGIPPLSGFFSKEAILLAAWERHTIVYVLALLTSGLTAFYMFRLYFSIFWNTPVLVAHPHSEGSWSMKLPLVLLGILSVATGFIPFAQFVTADGRSRQESLHLLFSIAPVALEAAGIGVAYALFKNPSDKPVAMAAKLGGLYRSARQKFYMDEVYIFITKKVIFKGIGQPAAWIDKHIIDGLMNGLASVTAKLSHWIRGIQSGSVQDYALYFWGGILTLTLLLLYLFP